jgi:nicotinamide mononucleotide transporter
MVDLFKRNVWVQTIVIAIVLTALSYGIGAIFGWVTVVNWLEIFAVFTSYASTYLCVKQRRFNYVFGAVSSVAYCYLFFTAGLLASTALNGILAVWLVYGWFRWRCHKHPSGR